MNAALLIANVVVLLAVLGLAFLVLGALRALGILTWRLDQMELMRPGRIGREGLKIGRKALDFTLPIAKPQTGVAVSDGQEPSGTGSGQTDANGCGIEHLSLSDFAGQKVLLVLTQSGCGPCMEIVPELNRLHARGQYGVLVVNNGEHETTREWVAETRARFPVLSQEKFSLSKRYQVLVTPFAFLIDEQGVIASKGIVGNRQYLSYVLSGAGIRLGRDDGDASAEDSAEKSEKSESDISVSTEEPFHV